MDKTSRIVVIDRQSSDRLTAKAFADMLPENPQIKYFNSRSHGYVSVTVEPKTLSARFKAISDRADPNAVIATEATFTVETGLAKVNQAT